MSEHVADELASLLTGEAGRDAVAAASAHLRECPDCRQELVSAVVAHASLSSARRYAPELLDVLPEAADRPRPMLAPLPDLSDLFTQTQQEAAVERAADERTRPARRALRNRYLIAAAAAVVIGAGTVTIVAATSGSSPASNATVVQLAAYDVGSHPALARISGSAVTIDATSLPAIADHRYEVWLTDPSRTHLQPVGWLGDGGRATLTVPADLLSRYSDIEVSVQQIDAPGYQYSGTSVLRGAYRT